MCFRFSFLITVLAWLAVSVPVAEAAAKRKPEPAPLPSNKPVVSVAPVEGVSIEMPDEKVYNFGDDFQSLIWDRLQKSGKAMVATEKSAEDVGGVRGTSQQLRGVAPLDYEWNWTFVPAARLKVRVEAMSFVTGARGERMFYGFDDRFRTPFNDGDPRDRNEFPLRTFTFEPNWFDRTFDAKGVAPFDSRVGLDLGDGLKVDALFAWLALKYALYRSHMILNVELEAPLAGRHELHRIDVRGEGFYFDAVGAYEGYSAGIRVARRDAMLRALRQTVDGTYEAIARFLEGLPLTARLDRVLGDGTLLLGTGYNAAVQPGILYEVVDTPSLIVEVTSSLVQGSVGRLIRGDASLLREGAILRQVQALPASPASAPASDRGVASVRQSLAAPSEGPRDFGTERIDLPWTNLPKSNFDPKEIPEISFLTALVKSLTETALLAHRVWRYFMYDQAYHQESDGGGTYYPGDTAEPAPPPGPEDWSRLLREEPWARQIGLGHVPLVPVAPTGDAVTPVVAIIDSGVDYNHPSVHDLLWLNPSPQIDSNGQSDRYGWDFVSGDSRPFDDSYHGTWLASLVTGINPRVRIMPLKVFNPWGITSSAAIYGAFVYAVDHGAQVIVCGWATLQRSKAIEMGVAYARSRGVVVVAAAGDRGDDLVQFPAYPAAFSQLYNNVIAVTGVDLNDALVRVRARYANYSADVVTLAAPGKQVLVAQPRNEQDRETSTAIAAGITAGALSRIIVTMPDAGYEGWIGQLRADAEQIPGLHDTVDGGLRLRVLR